MGNKPTIVKPSKSVDQHASQTPFANPPSNEQVENVRANATSQEHTCKQMEMEFDKIYEKSKKILGSLSKNPCHELTQRIIECLENNSMQMAKCFSVMDEYRICVKGQVNERLVRADSKLEVLKPVVHQIERTKEDATERLEEALLSESIGDQKPNNE